MPTYYNPVQNKTTTGPTKADIPGIFSHGSWGARQGASLHSMLSDPGWSTGQTFQANAKISALEALRNAQTRANPEDYAAMDEMRGYYRDILADLPSANAQRTSTFDTNAQYGLKNLLSQHKGANAGRGTIGSRQYAGAQGDIVSRANSDYIEGLLKARNDAVAQAGQIQSGLAGIQNQDLAERTFQGDQAAQYANLISNFMAQDQGREGQLLQLQGQKDAANKAMWGSIIGGLAAGAGSYAGGGGK